MHSSPYYRAVREFQEVGNLWEDRLTKLRASFDAWIDVQWRWVSLEGICKFFYLGHCVQIYQSTNITFPLRY